MAAVQVTSVNTNRQINSSRVSVRTSAGIPYVIVNQILGIIQVFKGNSVTPTSFTIQDDANDPAGTTYGSSSAAIDSTGVIHISYHYYNGKTSELRYVTFNTGTDTFSGDAQLVADIGGDPTAITNLYTAIAIDSNNVPHIAHSQFPSKGGLPSLYYMNKVGGAWNAAVEIEGGTNGNECKHYDIAISEDNIPEISYVNDTDGDLGAALGNVNNATSFTLFDPDITAVTSNVTSIVIDSAGNTYIGYEDINPKIVEHLDADAWTTWQTPIAPATGIMNSTNILSIVANGTDIYVFYEDDGHDISYNKYTGSWGSPVELETGTFNTAKAKWARYVDYDSSGANRAGAGGRLELDYTFTDETASADVWFNSLSLVTLDVATIAAYAVVAPSIINSPIGTVGY